MSYKIKINGKESLYQSRPKMNIDIEGVCSESDVASIDEAPMDGKSYVRCNGQWVEISTDTTTTT